MVDEEEDDLDDDDDEDEAVSQQVMIRWTMGVFRLAVLADAVVVVVVVVVNRCFGGGESKRLACEEECKSGAKAATTTGNAVPAVAVHTSNSCHKFGLCRRRRDVGRTCQGHDVIG